MVVPATHDTASAVASVPASGDDFIYISSGTWSLMGIERDRPDCSENSMKYNFTNEGGYGGRFRYLKNIMGLWMIQEVRRVSGNKYSFDELCRMAGENEDFPSRVDVNSPRFFSPEDMAKEVKDYCRSTNQKVPETYGELAACIYLSLAGCYAITAKELEAGTGKNYEGIHIVGGGSNAGYLNELTARISGKNVYAGPAEATAIGNIIVQMIKAGEFASLKEARECVYKSFDVKQVRP
jgi:rhamnulokinase